MSHDEKRLESELTSAMETLLALRIDETVSSLWFELMVTAWGGDQYHRDMSESQTIELLTSAHGLDGLGFDDSLMRILPKLWEMIRTSSRQRPGEENADVLVLRRIGEEFITWRDGPSAEDLPMLEELFLRATASNRELVDTAYRLASQSHGLN